MDVFTNIRFKGYKSFSADNLLNLDDIKPVNIFIGKNNAGKSNILTIVETCFDKNKAHSTSFDSLYIGIPLAKNHFNFVFDDPHYEENVYYEYAKKSIGKTFWFDVKNNRKINSNDSIYERSEQNEENFSDMAEYTLEKIVNNINTILDKWVFRKLSAERNIVPESGGDCRLESDGRGASSIIEIFINDVEHKNLFIRDELLAALNKITMPEYNYKSIDVKRYGSSWEVFLQEENAGLFALSQCGSGLKTILLVLLNLLIAPKIKGYEGKNICYGFEELENNLHPALQRRLFDYIYNYATTRGNVCVFLTTHSHMAINAFFGKKDAQIYHVTKEDNHSDIQKIKDHFDKVAILDDLGVKASDLLQSNGIIWVEGPSDKRYIKRWLEVFSDEKFEEGKHYQIVCYAGKLLSHFSAEVVTEEEMKYINMLTINRNAAIIIDSDRKYANDTIRATKVKIQEEFAGNNMFCWITEGKEIENYLPVEAISKALDKNVEKQCTLYDSFSEYIESSFTSFKHNKIEFADKVIPHIDKNNANIADVRDKILQLSKAIKRWNNIKEP